MKKHIVLLTSLLLLASLIGCGQGNDAQNETPQQSERTTTEVTTTAPVATTTAPVATTTAPVATTTAPTATSTPEPTKPQEYESIAYQNAVIQNPDSVIEWFIDDLVIVNSNDELAELDLGLDLGYDDDFFEDNALVLVQFTYAGGEDLLELSGIIVKDGKLCPVLTIESQEDLSANFEFALISAEVKKADVEDHEVGENLIIDKIFTDRDSAYHDKFDGILK